MIAIHSKLKETLVNSAKRAINNANVNDSSVEFHDNEQIVVVKPNSSLEDVIKAMKLKHVVARLDELQAK